MHPAYSVILFTTASGAGYGLLIWLCLLGTLSAVPATFELGFTGFALAFALIAMGLLASTAHLGRPERAWRAFSQWRTSWLSREGVAAMATFVPAGLYALSWVVLGTNSGFAGVLGLVTVLLALATVICTGMIYQSLATIRAWLSQFTNLLPIGRTGMFRYNNQDHAIATGLLAARTLLGHGRFDPWRVNIDAAYIEEGAAA